MHPRRIARLIELKQEQRFPVIGEGLTRLGDHVAGLAQSVRLLKGADDVRGAAALDIICTEEAAKALILLDMARCMHNQKELTRACKYFYDHLARGIYAYVHEGNPSLYAEVEGYVDDCRPSHYLDGPNDADWILRNELQRRRDTALYVDYEETEPAKYEWTGGNPDVAYAPQRITRLVLAMRTTGMLTEAGARAVAFAWKNSPFDSSTRWEYCRVRNTQVLRSLMLEGREMTPTLVEACGIVEQKWTFPLTQLDLSLDKSTTIEDLREQQRSHYNRMMIDEYGGEDYYNDY